MELQKHNPNQGVDLMNADSFNQLQRAAKAFASSTIVPKEYQGEQGLSNCIVAIDMAMRMNLSPTMVMQNLYIVHGRPTWKAEFVISRLHGKYSTVDFEQDDADGGRCRVVATKPDGTVVKGTWVSMKLAQDEGWISRSGSKWKTMPEQMLFYRAATFFARVHAPELLNGVADQYEALDAPESYTRESEAVQRLNDLAAEVIVPDADVSGPAPEATAPAAPTASPKTAEIVDDID
jgi:hypothetical protein